MGKAKGPRKSKEQKEAEAIAAPLQELLEQFKGTLGDLGGLDELDGFMESEDTYPTAVKEFVIDTGKIESLDDVKEVIKAMEMRILWYTAECPEKFKTIYERGLLKLDTDENI
jgi:hypothetical protein